MCVISAIRMRTLIRKFVPSHHVITIFAHSFRIKWFISVSALSHHFFARRAVFLFWLFFESSTASSAPRRQNFLTRSAFLRLWLFWERGSIVVHYWLSIVHFDVLRTLARVRNRIRWADRRPLTPDTRHVLELVIHHFTILLLDLELRHSLETWFLLHTA